MSMMLKAHLPHSVYDKDHDDDDVDDDDDEDDWQRNLWSNEYARYPLRSLIYFVDDKLS